MALSNIFREPQREITETLMGIAVASLFLWGDYHFALWFQHSLGDINQCPWPLGMMLGFVGVFFICLACVGIHELGEALCDFLRRRGLELRPKERR